MYTEKMFYVYMIRNSINRLYIGISENPEQRVQYHNNRTGAKFTKYVRNFRIVFLESYSNIVEARRREIQFKKWNRSKKDVLIKKYEQRLPTKLNGY